MMFSRGFSAPVSLIGCWLVLVFPGLVGAVSDVPGFGSSELIFEDPPHRSCHASTIIEAGDALVAAWFGGHSEGADDVGIWLARRDDGAQWSAPIEVANGVDGDTRYPTWNPVLAQSSASDAPLLLFYKVGPSPREWWGMLRRSNDGGLTWGPAERLPDDLLGPIRAKPITLADGTLVAGSSTEHDGWKVHFERYTKDGEPESLIRPVHPQNESFGVIQPSILVMPDGGLRALCRSQQERIVRLDGDAEGRQWGPLFATELPNPSAGVDVVNLDGGGYLLVYNHTTSEGGWPATRRFLNVATSSDGRTWSASLVLENQEGEYSYPAAIQAEDGAVHITYTYQRRFIKHVTVDPASLESHPIRGGVWPEGVPQAPAH